MLHDFIGREAFKNGMKHYLTTHSYQNTQTEDLWASLETASGKPVGKVMTTWTGQMGFPLIKVDSRLDGNTRILTLTQEKFNADGSSTAGALWNVPIKILKSNKEVIEVLMDQKELIVKLEDVQEQDWFKVNPDSFGIFDYIYKSVSRFYKNIIFLKENNNFF